ncbi:hypothetical protein ACFWXA_06325 [Streptomyces atroolivaceus]|uniref:hypothetical protein n=1 Tax=Streptomyces atroolivaceus TaxID=66869 RepID=UPI00365556E6
MHTPRCGRMVAAYVVPADGRGVRPGARTARESLTATRYAHVAAGRPYTSGGHACAKGSAQDMGPYNVFVTHPLRESPAGHFVIAGSGCQAGSS